MLSKKENRSRENKVTSCNKNLLKVESQSNQQSSLPLNPYNNENVINKQEKSSTSSSSSSSSTTTTEKHDTQQEITGGNCSIVDKGEGTDEKINTTPKKRFFDLKRTAESATSKISSISPSRFSLNNLTPKLRRKSATNHKLSQLERQSNLFIRDGSENKTNNPENLMSVAIENGTIDDNAKHQQTTAEGKIVNSNNIKSKKSSLIPSFNFKIPSTNAKQGNLKNLCKNFSRNEPDFPNYEEIDISHFNEVENNVNENLPQDIQDKQNLRKFSPSRQREILDTAETDLIEALIADSEQHDAMSKTELIPNVQEMLKNIPVRQRKGNISHMENYCLFDPAVDFYDDKELRRNNFATQSIADFHFPIGTFQNILQQQKVQKQTLQIKEEYSTVYDTTEHDERLLYHNYYEIDPDLLEQDEAAMPAIAIEPNRIDENPKSVFIGEQTSRQSSSSSSSCDYPSIFNSVIETTPSSTIESTDENETINNDIPQSGIIQTNENVITCNSETGTKKKSQPQLERIVLQQVAKRNTNQWQTMATRMNGKSTKINLQLFYNKADPLKSSHSLPQLQNIGITATFQQIADDGCDYKVEINKRTAAIPLRKTIRKARPLSSDSGFTTPSPPNEISSSNPSQCPTSNSSNNANGNGQVDNYKTTEASNNNGRNESTVLNHCDNIQQLIEIYTEWANYYLERHKSKRKVVDLSADARDGLLLAEIIEAVTSFKVPDLIKKPKNQQQMFDNVEACLIILRQNCVPGVEIITTNDIISGRLKAILSLFFSLSRFKQASKLKAPVRPLHSHDMMLTKERQLPVYTKTANGATAIPLPATVLVTRRCPPDKIRPLPPTPNHQSSIPSNKIASGSPSNESSRPNSPPDNNTPTKNGLRGSSKIPNPPYTSPQNGSNGSLLTNANLQQQEQQQAQQTPTKHSMLGKLKIFGKDKSTESPKTQLSKRTSSSSGFSSARSERSDSSLSLNNESTNIPTSQSSSSNKSTSTKKSDTGKVSNKAKVPAPATTINNNNITTAGKSSKGDKKDKSQLNNQAKESNGINAGANTDISPTKVHKIPQAKLQVPVGRKSESKTGLSSQQQQAKASTQSTSVSTSIPKPMAAIKGTSKTLQQQQMECNDKNQNNEHFDVIKVEKVSISVQNNNEIVQKTQIVNPLGMSPLHNHQLLNQTNNNNINGNNNNINGMQSATLLMSDSLRLTSTNNQSNSSDSSVIYRTASAAISTGGQASETNIHADIYQMQSHTNPISNRKLENFNDPLLINGNKFGMIPAKVNGVAQTIFEDDKETTSTMVPMRSLMRGFNNHMSSPSRMNRTMNGYYDENGQGYCSDGDAFRKSSIRYSDIENGYLSEGPHFLSILRNRPQMPSTIAEERCQSSREGNLDSADMESNSSKNSRDYWSNQQAASPTSSRKDKTSSPSHSRRSTPSAKSSSRTKGVPQNFGYIKRTNGSSTASEIQTNAMLTGGRTAHVSAVPRSNKLKVSGGTQTSTADFQQKLQNPQYRSFSLTGPGAAQLSQSVKERFGSHSLPKGGLDMHVFQQRMANRGSAKLNDGSLSDTQTYAEVKPEYNTYAMWLKHNSGTTANRLSEGDSLEAVSIVSSPGLSRNSKLLQQSRDSTPQSSAQQTGQNSKLNRSNSISYLQERTYPRSTKSEKMYPSMLSRGPDIESEPYYCLPVNAQGMVPWSQPTSPQPTPSRGFTGLLSPTHNTSHRLTYPKKNDEVHGSQISLMSGGSSMYGSTTEEQRQANEVRRLKRELTEAREQVMSLSSQLSTNAHVVNAFEQSLQNMTNRLQQLTATTEKKESEITEMRQTIELLRKQSIQAGLTQAHMQSMGVQVNVNGSSAKIINGSPTKINGQQEQHLHHQHHQHHQLQPQQQQQNGNMQRQHSTDSMCSVNSNGSNGSSSQEKKKKKGWLRSSFTKAFSRNAKITKTNRQTNHSDSKSSLPPTPQKNSSTTIHDSHGATGKLSPTKSPHRYIPVVENAKPVDSIENDNHPVIEDLKKQLREKDMVLTDIRLEALTQASQMENLKDTVQKMRQEMMNLKQNNERLQRMVSTRSLAGSEASLHGCPASPSGSLGDSRRYSLATDNGMSRPPLELPQNLDENEEEPPAPAPDPPPAPLSPTIITDLSPTIERISISNEILSTPAEDVADPVDGKRIGIAVFLGQPEAFVKYSDDMNEQDQSYDFKTRENGFDLLHSQETIIACTYISGKTTWQNLDYIVRKTFKDYLSRIDPSTNLGLNTDSITSYHLGEAKRGPEMGFPELLPCGYIIGHVKTLYICLQGVGSLAFDSLIPRSIVHRYINLLTEHRRLILCGPKGTGKSYLARKLAEFLVAKSNRSPAESIATFNVDNKSSNLQQYLGTIAEQATINGAAEELPLVIILDNLHHASALGDVFSCLLSAGPAAKLPCIIGTMSQATCNTTNLQLHHNFRWVLTANHMEPVKGFLGRYLRRRLFHHDLLTGSQQTQMEKVFKWLPGVWLHVNTFLENHSSSDVTIGPQLFLQCPLSEEDSQKWFVDLWNHQLAPYLVDAIKEGVQLYGRRGNSWTDPCLYVRETYPWKITPTTVPTLRQITADDVGLEAGVTGNMDSDPLLNMLHMLQQAAASENVDHDNSDCASLDSNFTHESAGTEQ